MTSEGAGRSEDAGRSAEPPKRSGGSTSWWRLASLVARREYLRTVRRRGFIFGTLLLPLGVAVLMTISGFFSGAADGAGDRSVRVVVVNESDVPLEASAAALPGVTLATREEADTMLEQGVATRYYVVPAGYPSRPTVQRIEAERGEGVAALGADPIGEQVVAVLLRDALLRDAGVEPETARRIVEGIVVEAETTRGEPVTGAAVAAGIVAPIVLVTLFMVSIFITSGYLLQSVTEEKENRVVEIVLSSVPSAPLMGGKILGLGAAGLTQVAIWMVTAILALPLLADRFGDLGDVVPEPAVLVLALVYFILGYLAYGAIFAAIGAMAPGNREAQQYSGFFGFIAAIPFVLLAAFLSDLDSVLVAALAIFPLTAPTAMLLVLGLAPEIPWPFVSASLASLTLSVVLVTWGAGRIFHATVLLYGARPSLGRILGALRTAR